MTVLRAILAAASIGLATAPANGEILFKSAAIVVIQKGAPNEMTCELELQPQAPPNAAERIVLRASDRKKNGALTDVLELIIRTESPPTRLSAVVGDRRITQQVMQTLSLDGQSAPDILQALLAKRSVHITAHDRDGRVSSARFQTRHLGAALQAMHGTCGVDTQRLSPVASLFARDERKLEVEQSVLRRAAWVLHAQYARRLEQPAPAFDAQTRSFLLRYSIEQGLVPTRYLDRETLAHLGAARYTPTSWSHRRHDNFTRYTDWYVYTRGTGARRTCTLESEATAAIGALVWRYPHMRLWANARGVEGDLHLDLVTPNVFDLGAASAELMVDHHRFGLGLSEGAVIPVNEAGQPAWRFVRQVMQGLKITMKASADDGHEDLLLEFSARGFTAGFRAIMELCAREDLKAWF